VKLCTTFSSPGGPKLLPNEQTRDGCIGTTSMGGRRSPAVRVSLKCPVDRDGCLLQATAAPDVSLIETTLAGGTVEREIIRAGPSAEGRTAAVLSAVEFTKGWVWGAAGHGPRQTQASVTAPCQKNGCERTRTQRTAIQYRRCRPGRDNDTRTAHSSQHHRRWRPGGSAPQTPRDLSRWCQSRRVQQKRDAPPGHPGSDPGP
jgi:hypothetical protein